MARRLLSIEQTAEAMKMLHSGKTLQYVAKRYNKSPGQVSLHIHHATLCGFAWWQSSNKTVLNALGLIEYQAAMQETLQRIDEAVADLQAKRATLVDHLALSEMLGVIAPWQA